MTKEEIISEQLGMEYHSMTSDQLSVYHRCMDEYAKQQTIAFLKDIIKNQTLYPTTDETICIDGIGVDDRKFNLAASHFYGKFIENQHQNKDK